MIGVIVPDTIETTISEQERLTIKMFRTDCNERCLNILKITSKFPTKPRLNFYNFLQLFIYFN